MSGGILVVGSLNMDMSVRVAAMPAGGETVLGKSLSYQTGEKGALLVNEQKQLLLEAEKVNGIDTTAAGDCFNGALAVALAEGKPLEESISFANKAAAIAVTRRGAIESLPYRDEMASEERISGVTSKQIKA